MKASIITIGDELLIGQVTDTNSAWLAGELTATGFSVQNLLSISDSSGAIESALENLLPSNDLLILTGGLGPTNDDITRNLLTSYFNTRLVQSNEVLQDVQAFISGVGSKMNSLNEGQALVPEGAKILRNHHGTAPGFWFERDSKVVISLPGVPREMKGIFNDYIRSALARHFSLPRIIYKSVMLTGISEAHLAEKLQGWEKELPAGMSLAYLPSPGRIRLRLGMQGDDSDRITDALEDQTSKLELIIPKYIFSYEDESLEAAAGRLINKEGRTLSVAESCTGGTISSRITAIPGCSEWYRGGITAYSNEIKRDVLGVEAAALEEFGAVSAAVVEQMALGAMRIFGSDYAVATSGIAGPSGGTAEKPVGTVWTAAAGPGFTVSRKFSFGSNRAMNIERSAAAAVNLLRRAILGI